MNKFFWIMAGIFLFGFWPVFGMTLNDTQAQAILEGIKQLEKERDEAKEAARYWKDKAKHVCT